MSRRDDMSLIEGQRVANNAGQIANMAYIGMDSFKRGWDACENALELEVLGMNASQVRQLKEFWLRHNAGPPSRVK